MHILIIGAAGMLGRKTAQRLAVKGELNGRKIDRLSLVDVVQPSGPEGFEGQVDCEVLDLSKGGAAEALVSGRPDVIIHLAAIVSSDAEANFEKGYSINLDGTRSLFEAIRTAEKYVPKVVFTSSVAVFGTPLPATIGDDEILTPLTSYGTQKAMGELLLADYSRRGFFDGIGIRLPTICVRPGVPNKAASGFFSSILREPLKGEEAILPVSDDVRHWFASPRAAVEFIVHAAELDTLRMGTRRNLTMPGVCATVADEIEALRRVAGDDAVKLIRREENPAISAIIATWPEAFDTRRAAELGFVPDKSFEDIIRIHIEDEMGGGTK